MVIKKNGIEFNGTPSEIKEAMAALGWDKAVAKNISQKKATGVDGRTGPYTSVIREYMRDKLEIPYDGPIVPAEKGEAVSACRRLASKLYTMFANHFNWTKFKGTPMTRSVKAFTTYLNGELRKDLETSLNGCIPGHKRLEPLTILDMVRDARTEIEGKKD